MTKEEKEAQFFSLLSLAASKYGLGLKIDSDTRNIDLIGKCEMKNLHIIAKMLTKDGQKLTNRLFRLTSAAATNRESLTTLAADAGTLAYEWAKLRVDIAEIKDEKDKK